MERESFVMYRSFWDAIRELPNEDIANSIKAIAEYALNGVPPDVSGVAKSIFIMAKPNIDRSNHFMEGQNARNCGEYAKWRQEVYERDRYTCQKCGEKGGKLNAHHIKPFSRFKHLRFEPDNGVTLCEKCHREVHRSEK